MMNFDELILDAAKSIANATSQLIKAAGAAQQELVAQGKVSQRVQMSTEDGQWSKGKLIFLKNKSIISRPFVDTVIRHQCCK